MTGPARQCRPTPGEMDGSSPAPGRSRTLPRRPRARDAPKDEDDAEPGTWMVRADDLQEKAEDPAGTAAARRPGPASGPWRPGGCALGVARGTAGPDAGAGVRGAGRRGSNPLARRGSWSAPSPSGIAYPEWDWRAAAYRPGAAVVRERVAEAGSAAWVEGALRRHAAMIRTVRRDFERLRPRRVALRRQPDGAELDIDALVAAYADRRGGGVADDRFYIDTRPVRRDAAIMLLVDASASTDGWVAGDRRIIDVEKEALLIVGEALAALGDPHAVMAFASAGPARVTVQVLKRFDGAFGNRGGPSPDCRTGSRTDTPASARHSGMPPRRCRSSRRGTGCCCCSRMAGPMTWTSTRAGTASKTPAWLSPRPGSRVSTCSA